MLMLGLGDACTPGGLTILLLLHNHNPIIIVCSLLTPLLLHLIIYSKPIAPVNWTQSFTLHRTDSWLRLQPRLTLPSDERNYRPSMIIHITTLFVTIWKADQTRDLQWLQRTNIATMALHIVPCRHRRKVDHKILQCCVALSSRSFQLWQ